MKYFIIKSALASFFLALALGVGAQTASIGGTILDLNGVGITNITVNALDDNGDVAGTTVTDATGNYLLTGLPTEATYTIVPAKADDPLNGLNVLDMMLARAYILLVQLPASPYGLLAADVNETGTVTTLDLVQMGKVILGFPEPLNLDWRFYRDDIVFDNPANPFGGYSGGSTELYLTENTTGFGFTGVKPGDLDGSATP